MIEINPNKIKKAEIVVGFPSFQEADTIVEVVKQVDLGLKKYFGNKKAVLINCDNNSQDNTREVFLSVKTKTPKIYLSTEPGIKGKGNNLRNLFLKIKSLGAGSAMVVDTDIKNVKPKWVKCLLSPIIAGYDYVSPIYWRDENDGSITNFICYPLVHGLLGYDIRQPITGEVGFSKRLTEYWLKQKWTAQVRQFGIDIFMTVNAIKGNFKFCRADLGSKIHKPSAPKLDFMFLEVVGALFRLLSENKNLWQKEIKIKKLPLVCKVKTTEYPDFDLDYKPFEKKALAEFLLYYQGLKKYLSPKLCLEFEQIFLKKKEMKIDNKLWTKIVYEMLYLYQTRPNKETVIKFLRALYFGRIASFTKQVLGKNRQESEKIIQAQVEYFYETRKANNFFSF